MTTKPHQFCQVGRCSRVASRFLEVETGARWRTTKKFRINVCRSKTCLSLAFVETQGSVATLKEIN